MSSKPKWILENLRWNQVWVVTTEMLSNDWLSIFREIIHLESKVLKSFDTLLMMQTYKFKCLFLLWVLATTFNLVVLLMEQECINSNFTLIIDPLYSLSWRKNDLGEADNRSRRKYGKKSTPKLIKEKKLQEYKCTILVFV